MEAYQHMVKRTDYDGLQDLLDEYGPKGFRVVSIIRRPLPRKKPLVVVLESERP